MRRKDREVTGFDNLLTIMRKCEVCHLALHDGDYPYLVPLSFGLAEEGGRAVLYFHSALEGKKLELMRQNNKAAFAMDCGRSLSANVKTGMCTMAYESVLGRGTLLFVPPEERHAALCVLMGQYHVDDAFVFNTAAEPKTAVFKLVVEEMTGKRHP